MRVPSSSPVATRQAAGPTRIKLANRLHRPQSYVSEYGNGERWLDVVELLKVMDGFGTHAMNIVTALIAVEA